MALLVNFDPSGVAYVISDEELHDAVLGIPTEGRRARGQ